MTTDTVCILCGAPAPGLILTEDYEWVCKDEVACIARMVPRPAVEELGNQGYTTPERVAEAIDADYEQRRRRK